MSYPGPAGKKSLVPAVTSWIAGNGGDPLASRYSQGLANPTGAPPRPGLPAMS